MRVCCVSCGQVLNAQPEGEAPMQQQPQQQQPPPQQQPSQGMYQQQVPGPMPGQQPPLPQQQQPSTLYNRPPAQAQQQAQQQRPPQQQQQQQQQRAPQQQQQPRPAGPAGTMPVDGAGRGGAHRGGARGGARGGGSNRGRGMVASGQFTVGDIKKMDDDFDFAATTASFDKMAVKEEAKQAAPDITPGYDKKSSFFDNISCESSAGNDRSGGYNRFLAVICRYVSLLVNALLGGYTRFSQGLGARCGTVGALCARCAFPRKQRQLIGLGRARERFLAR